MKKIALIAVAAGVALILVGMLARSPGQIAISTAVIATGVFIILFVAVLTAVLYFKAPNGSGSEK